MYRYEAKEAILTAPLELFLERDRSRNGYICPICGSGSGRHGTGLSTLDGLHYKCWCGCFSHADVIDLIGMEYHLSAYNDKLRKGCELIGIDYTQLQADPSNMRSKKHDVKLPPLASQNKTNDKPQNELQIDYTGFYNECMRYADKSDYLQRRGISRAIQHLHHIGLCMDWRNPDSIAKGKKPPTSPRLIIPYTKYSYFARDIRPDTILSEYEREFTKTNVGKAALFNGDVLTTATEPIFITESAIDALSIEQVGHVAIGLGGTGNTQLLIKAIAEHKTIQPLILLLDSDKAGRQATIALAQGLRNVGKKKILSYYLASGNHKDPNEMLVNEPEAFKEAVEKALEYAMDGNNFIY